MVTTRSMGTKQLARQAETSSSGPTKLPKLEDTGVFSQQDQVSTNV